METPESERAQNTDSLSPLQWFAAFLAASSEVALEVYGETNNVLFDGIASLTDEEMIQIGFGASQVAQGVGTIAGATERMAMEVSEKLEAKLALFQPRMEARLQAAFGEEPAQVQAINSAVENFVSTLTTAFLESYKNAGGTAYSPQPEEIEADPA